MQSQKWQNDLCLFPRQTINITIIQVCAPTSNTEEAEVEWFCEDLQGLLELTPKKDILFITAEDRNANVGSQEKSGVTGKFSLNTEWSRAKSNRVLPREHTGYSKHLFQQHKRRLYTWTSQMVNADIRLIIFFAAKDGEVLYNQQKQDQELTVVRSWTLYCQIQT